MRNRSAAMVVVFGLCAALPAAAQPSPMPQAALDRAASRARVMAIAPLCGLRDRDWAADLGRAALEDALGTHNGATASGTVSAALGYGETEALEDFAADRPEATCTPLARSRALGDADRTVLRWRSVHPRPSS